MVGRKSSASWRSRNSWHAGRLGGSAGAVTEARRALELCFEFRTTIVRGSLVRCVRYSDTLGGQESSAPRAVE